MDVRWRCCVYRTVVTGALLGMGQVWQGDRASNVGTLVLSVANNQHTRFLSTRRLRRLDIGDRNEIKAVLQKSAHAWLQGCTRAVSTASLGRAFGLFFRSAHRRTSTSCLAAIACTRRQPLAATQGAGPPNLRPGQVRPVGAAPHTRAKAPTHNLALSITNTRHPLFFTAAGVG